MNVQERQSWFRHQESVDPRLGVWFRVREVAWEMEEGKGKDSSWCEVRGTHSIGYMPHMGHLESPWHLSPSVSSLLL